MSAAESGSRSCAKKKINVESTIQPQTNPFKDCWGCMLSIEDRKELNKFSQKIALFCEMIEMGISTMNLHEHEGNIHGKKVALVTIAYIFNRYSKMFSPDLEFQLAEYFDEVDYLQEQTRNKLAGKSSTQECNYANVALDFLKKNS